MDKDFCVDFSRQIDRNGYVLSEPNSISYKYSNGKMIIESVNENCIKSTISTVPFSPIVAEKGGVLLHSAGVLSKRTGKLIIISASSGVGKTTLSTYLTHNFPNEFEIFSDDAIALYKSDYLMAFPGPCFSKIGLQTATQFKLSVEEKSLFKEKYFLNHSSSSRIVGNGYRVEKIIFLTSSPNNEIVLVPLDKRALSPFIKTSIPGISFFSIEQKKILIERALFFLKDESIYTLHYFKNYGVLNKNLLPIINS